MKTVNAGTIVSLLHFSCCVETRIRCRLYMLQRTYCRLQFDYVHAILAAFRHCGGDTHDDGLEIAQNHLQSSLEDALSD